MRKGAPISREMLVDMRWPCISGPMEALLQRANRIGRCSLFERLIERGFNVMMIHHAEAILDRDMPDAVIAIEETLLDVTIPVTELVAGGGGEALVTQRIRRAFHADGWRKQNIIIEKTLKLTPNGEPRVLQSTSHEIDHVKTFNAWTAALEIEWNNKDPFYDRDLENFKRLHAEGAISVGGLITRGDSLHRAMRNLIRQFADQEEIATFADLVPFGYTPTTRQQRIIEARAARSENFRHSWADFFVSDKFGEATTHWNKLIDRVNRGVGNPCPLILIGIPDSVITVDYAKRDDGHLLEEL